MLKNNEKLRETLRRILDVLVEELERNPEFANALSATFVNFAKGKISRQKKKAMTMIPDPFEAFRALSLEGFLAWLNKLTIPELRAIVRQHRFDPSRLSDRWKTKKRFVELIIERVEGRGRQGESFRHYDQIEQNTDIIIQRSSKLPDECRLVMRQLQQLYERLHKLIPKQLRFKPPKDSQRQTEDIMETILSELKQDIHLLAGRSRDIANMCTDILIPIKAGAYSYPPVRTAGVLDALENARLALQGEEQNASQQDIVENIFSVLEDAGKSPMKVENLGIVQHSMNSAFKEITESLRLLQMRRMC